MKRDIRKWAANQNNENVNRRRRWLMDLLMLLSGNSHLLPCVLTHGGDSSERSRNLLGYRLLVCFGMMGIRDRFGFLKGPRIS